MGRCIKCGKETKNSYSYYTGEYQKSELLDQHYSGGKLSSYTERKFYTNVRQHSEYLCSRHVVAEQFSALWTMLHVIAVAMPLFLIIFCAQTASGNHTAGKDWVSIVIFFCAAFVLSVSAIVLIRNHKGKKDSRCDEEQCADKIIAVIKRRNKQEASKNGSSNDTRYFTPKKRPS